MTIYLVLLAFLPQEFPDTFEYQTPTVKQKQDDVTPSTTNTANKSREDNAATLYKRAFELTPKKSDLTEDEVSALNDWQTAPQENVAQTLLKRYEPVLQLIRQANTCPKCDWGRMEILKKQGVMFVNSLEQPRFLVEITCLRSRVLLAAGKREEALDDMFIILTFVRRFDTGDEMIRKLSATALEKLILQEMARQVYEIQKVETLRGVLKRFDAVPQASTVANVLKREKEWMSAWITQENVLIQIKPHLKEWEALKDESARVAETPHTQRAAAIQQFSDKLETVAPELRVMIAGVELAKICKADDISVAIRHLFRAGLTVLIGGPEAIRNSKDPFSNGPFKFRRLAEGIELRSMLRWGNDEDVKLVFGRGDE